MAQTWIVQMPGGVATASPNYAFAALVNRQSPATDAYLEVREVWARQRSSSPEYSSVDNPIRRLKVARTTGMSGDREASFQKHDSNAAALPSQVKAYVSPGDFGTMTTLTVYSDDCLQLQTQSGTSALHSRQLGFGPPGMDLARGFSFGRQSAVQPFVLREGQGLVITTWENLTRAHLESVELLITNVATGATYSVVDSAVATGNYDSVGAIGIWNGSGSGVVLGIRAIYHPLLYPHTEQVAGLRLSIVDEVYGGAAVTPTPYDTVNPALPSWVAALAGPCEPRFPGSRRGMPEQDATAATKHKLGTLWSNWQNIFPMEPDGTTVTPLPPGCLFKARGGGQGIVLRGGEGLAIVMGRDGTETETRYNAIDAEFVFSYVPEEAAASAAKEVSAAAPTKRSGSGR